MTGEQKAIEPVGIDPETLAPISVASGIELGSIAMPGGTRDHYHVIQGGNQLVAPELDDQEHHVQLTIEIDV